MTHRFYFIFTFCSFWVYNYAQPVLTNDVAPTLGDTTEYGYSNSFIEPGPSGPNQTWVLDELSLSFATTVCISSAGTPFQGNFPAATYCIKTSVPGDPTAYEYFSKSGSDIRYHGLARLGGLMIQYGPFWLRKYPMKYDSIQSSSFTATRNLNGQTTFSKLQVQRHYDAYGKMIWQGMTRNNAMRLKILVMRTDSISVGSGAHLRTISKQEWYQYFLPNVHGHIAFTWRIMETQLIIDAQGDTIKKMEFPPYQQTEVRSDSDLVEIETPGKEAADLDFLLLENPVTDLLTVQLRQPDFTSAVTLSIFSLDGKMIHQEVANTSLQRYELDVSLLPAGHYLLRVFDGSRVGSKIWVKQ